VKTSRNNGVTSNLREISTTKIKNLTLVTIVECLEITLKFKNSSNRREKNCGWADLLGEDREGEGCEEYCI
jgi:hypothetical protein